MYTYVVDVHCRCKGYKSSDSNQQLPTVLEAIELVAVCLLEPIPITESEPVSVQGKLHEHSSFWLEASSFVRDLLSHGYRIPFIKRASGICFQSNPRIIGYQLCRAPISVVENSRGKLRLVLDLRYINQFLPEQKFKYEGLSLVPQMFMKRDYFVTLILI